MHRPFVLGVLALGLISVISKLFYELATIRESGEGSIARHLHRELATSRSASPTIRNEHMQVRQMEVLQLEKLVQWRSVFDALNRIDSITARPLSRKARTVSPWNHQPSVPNLGRMYKGLEDSLLSFVQEPPQIRAEDHTPFKGSQIPPLAPLCIPRCLEPRPQRVHALEPHQRGVRWSLKGAWSWRGGT